MLGYMLHPSIPEPARQALNAATFLVCTQLAYSPSWCTDVSTFASVLFSGPDELFRQSIQQDAVLYRATNLEVYTVQWIWLLVQKMKRLQMGGVDLKMAGLEDCVAIAKIVYEKNGPIGSGMLQQFDFDLSESERPVFSGTAKIVGDTAVGVWGVFPFVLEGMAERY